MDLGMYFSFPFGIINFGVGVMILILFFELEILLSEKDVWGDKSFFFFFYFSYV